MNAIKNDWDKIKETVRKENNITALAYYTWIASIKLCRIEDNVIYILLSTDQEYVRDYIASKYKGYIRTTVTEMYNHPYDIEFVLESEVRK